MNNIIFKYVATPYKIETPLEIFLSGVTKANVHHFVFNNTTSDFIRRFDYFFKPIGLSDLQMERQVNIIKITPELIGFNKIKSIQLEPSHTHMCIWNSRIIPIGVNTITSNQWNYILNNESKYFYYVKKILPPPSCIKKEYIWENKKIGDHNVRLLVEKI